MRVDVGTAAIDATESVDPSAGRLRWLLGAQVNVLIVRLFVQLNLATQDPVLASVALGLRVASSLQSARPSRAFDARARLCGPAGQDKICVHRCSRPACRISGSPPSPSPSPSALPGGAAVGQTGPRVKVTFQPDCFRSSLAAACDPRKVGDRLDLGPQIAVWIETADGQFVDTVMVTNLTAQLGIGNRPGHSTLPSGPKFPYGRRPMVLPVWAHQRNKLYDSVVMQDGLDKEYWLGFHEVVSSPDPYFCRPMTLEEIDVDAVSCPTQRFNSVKGRFFDPAHRRGRPARGANGTPKPYVPPAKSYYPPRNDLRTFVEQDCDRDRGADLPHQRPADTPTSTTWTRSPPPRPAYGQPFSRSWRVPDSVPDGDYAVLVEVSKEFDHNASHAPPGGRRIRCCASGGIPNNFGQPSVVFRVPFKLDRAAGRPAGRRARSPATATGTGAPAPCTRPTAPSATRRARGSGRLLNITQPAGRRRPIQGRVHVVDRGNTGGTPPEPPARRRGPCDGPDADGGADAAGGCAQHAPAVAEPGCRPAVGDQPGEAWTPRPRQVTFVEPTGAAWERVESYEVRRWNGTEQTAEALRRRPAAARDGQVGARGDGDGAAVEPQVRDPVHRGRARRGASAWSRSTAFASFTTRHPGVHPADRAASSPPPPTARRWPRTSRPCAGSATALRARSPLAAAAADVYARSSPPLADALRASEAARAVARTLLAPAG